MTSTFLFPVRFTLLFPILYLAAHCLHSISVRLVKMAFWFPSGSLGFYYKKEFLWQGLSLSAWSDIYVGPRPLVEVFFLSENISLSSLPPGWPEPKLQVSRRYYFHQVSHVPS